MVSTFRIVLSQDEGYDAHQTREFDLELDSKFAVGRASKNVSKGYLLPAKNNVYIDSPVVSREHALLTANATSGTPQVYITDTKSMHGTHVNGVPLVPQTPKQLFNGDKLQFGVNVNRNDSYFLAFKYTFNAELSNPEPFSRGFTVPDAESDEEELGFVQAGRGSQLNPLVLDDSDVASEHEHQEDYEEEAEQSEDNVDVTLAQVDDGEKILEIDSSFLVEEEEEDVAGSVADDFDDSDAASTGSAPSYIPGSALSQEAQHVEEVVQVQATPIEREEPSTAQFQFLNFSPASQPGGGDGESASVPSPTQTFSLPVWQDNNDHITFPSSMVDSTIAPPLPPRPSQKRQRISDGPVQDEQASMVDVPSNIGIPSGHGGLDSSSHSHFSVFRASERIQTPPPTLPSPEAVAPFAAFGDSAMCPTDLSIPDIIDGQPPTPTSINSRKRSADDAFDEDTKEIIEQEAAEAKVEIDTPETAARTVEQVAPQPQRPIAQPKSILRRALSAAKVMVPATALGAVFTVGALTALPESFFTVA